MPFYSPPPACPGYQHFRSDFVDDVSPFSGRRVRGWVYSIVHLASGQTIRAISDDLVEIAHLIDTQIILPVFGGRS